ncbi:5'-3' exoribonuclease [Rhizoctonia solani]|uniref:Flap endonuclease 1 n=1 Tax=Rhizoctonia solani TaxID=456999 RepID=A0A8H8T3Y4_9AGAM|nr:5'-3' exoribonuclease [Rhizoctonia solani]QRW26998.1 5'-3' exoribonuclease [Rhizoctonia solani]
MGIKGLTGLLSEHAPASIKEHDIKTLFGRKVAIDASMSIYQFLIAVRQQDGQMLTNEAGETTSHLMGFFYRTLRMVDHGIKPAYVFDGKPPDLKSGVLSKRFEGRQKAKEDGEEAKEVGTAEDVEKFARRTVRVTREHNEECRKLLKLMGIPCVVAPSEAEAQCAELARGGKVYAAGSEDMDTLTFNAPVLYRHLTFSEAKKAPISEIVLEKALEGLGMNMEQFTELCILLGCDYLEPIKGVGPKNAFKLMQEHGSLEEVLKVLRAKMAEREEADLKKEHKAKSTSKKGSKPSKSKKKDEEDEDEAMESEEEEKPKAKKQKSTKSKNRIESDDEEGSDPWDDTEAVSSPARDSSPTRASSPAASSEAGMKIDEDEDTKVTSASEIKDGAAEDDKDHKMEDVAAKADDAETKADEAPKKPAPVRRGGIHVPDYYPWEEAKKLFLQPDVTPADQVELVWEAPDVDGLVKFLVVEKGFNEERVRKGAEKLTKMLNTKQQGRLDGFFKVTESASSKAKATAGKGAASSKGAGAKRKADEKKDTGGKKAKTGGKK